MVVAQVDGGHPLFDDELPQVPSWRRLGARQRQAVRQLLGHSRWRRQGVNYKKILFTAVHITCLQFASQQYSMSDFNYCLNHPTDPWRLLLLGQYPRVPDNRSIWLALPKKTNQHKMNIFMTRRQPSSGSIPFYVEHQMAKDLTRIHDYG